MFIYGRFGKFWLSKFSGYVDGKRDIIPNILNLNGKQYFKKWFEENNLENNITFTMNNSNYINNKISFK